MMDVDERKYYLATKVLDRCQGRVIGRIIAIGRRYGIRDLKWKPSSGLWGILPWSQSPQTITLFDLVIYF